MLSYDTSNGCPKYKTYYPSQKTLKALVRLFTPDMGPALDHSGGYGCLGVTPNKDLTGVRDQQSLVCFSLLYVHICIAIIKMLKTCPEISNLSVSISARALNFLGVSRSFTCSN